MQTPRAPASGAGGSDSDQAGCQRPRHWQSPARTKRARGRWPRTARRAAAWAAAWPAAFMRVRDGFTARQAQKHHAADFHETRQRQRTRKAQQHSRRGRRPGRQMMRRNGRGVGMRRDGIEQPQKHQPLAHKTIQGRQSGNGHGAQREQPGGPRHGAPEPAQPTHFARARGVQHRTGAQKQQRLEQTVIPDMQQSSRQRQPAPGGVAMRGGNHGKPQANENDADVFHAVIGQQAL